MVAVVAITAGIIAAVCDTNVLCRVNTHELSLVAGQIAGQEGNDMADDWFTPIDTLTEQASRELTAQCGDATRCARVLNGRSCADLAAEIDYVVTRTVDALSAGTALCEILAECDIADELRDDAALLAGALFLGRRLIQANTAAIEELCPGRQFTAVLAVGARLGQSSRRIARTLQEQLDRYPATPRRFVGDSDDQASQRGVSRAV